MICCFGRWRVTPTLRGGGCMCGGGWLRRWHTTTHDRGSRLTLEFGAPITGNWQVALGLIPRTLWPAGVTLSFPAAQGKATTPAAYAYRARDLAVSLTRTTGVAPLELLKQFKQPEAAPKK